MPEMNWKWRGWLRSVVPVAVVLALATGGPARADEQSPWRTIHTGPVYAVAVTPSATPGEPGVIFAAVGSAILKSADVGLSWSTVLVMQASSLAADPVTPGVVYAATLNGLYKISDYGASWALKGAFAPVAAVAVHHFDPRIIYADNRRSLDGGTTWILDNLPGFTFRLDAEMAHFKVSQDPAFPNLALCVVGNSLFRSDDAGATWTQWGVLTKEDTIEIDPVDAQYIYEGTCSSGAMRRYFPGGSATMYLPGNGGHVHDLVVDPLEHNKVYAVNESTLYESTDFGVSWTSAAGFGTIPEGRMIIDPTSGNIYLPTFGAATGLLAKMNRCTDADHDGFSAAGGLCGPVDCDDNDPARTPGPSENCFDGIDNNCNDLADFADPWCGSVCVDTDGDSFLPIICGGSDCNNADPNTFPGAPELCDCRDNNCNGGRDEGCAMLSWYRDTDGDGFGAAATTVSNTCQPAGYVANALDCNDGDAGIAPGATETLNDGIDQDCNGADLTLVITKALWTRNKKTLTVEATTSLGSQAAAAVDGFGAMTWKRTYWTKTISGVLANPGTVTVAITGGSVTAAVATK